MKTKFFTLTAILLTIVTAVSCSSDDDKTTTGMQNAYEYDGAKTDIAWAGYYEELQDGYVFSVAPTTPTGNLYNQRNYFSVELPKEQLNKKADLSQSLDGASWYFFGAIAVNGNHFYFDDLTNDPESEDDVTGTDNWVKVTKNSSGANNFTLEFEMTINGKRLKGGYSGNFTKYPNYSDVASGS